MMRLIIAVALVAIGARTAYYFYVTKKPKGGRGDLGEEVIKPHTPATLDSDIGYFELVIKMYLQGRMSHHFHELQEGDYLPMKGPDPRDASSINLAKLKLLGRLLETLALLLCSKYVFWKWNIWIALHMAFSFFCCSYYHFLYYPLSFVFLGCQSHTRKSK
ncbi:hypothetical protein CICLE_v10018210mg [Citrus x clementina]|uniref:Flavoprotein pyridine nucleotide cytochrome reductase-like FAD-binding domain-containing protein n=1 Tax=Citrus clementina TaxID=85681 RepID=V4U745_CITCL|nr:hypothetical protein CICLE_v10018210mg [Citrus x clementina]